MQVLGNIFEIYYPPYLVVISFSVMVKAWILHLVLLGILSSKLIVATGNGLQVVRQTH